VWWVWWVWWDGMDGRDASVVMRVGIPPPPQGGARGKAPT
jgi:hypothetical protein